MFLNKLSEKLGSGAKVGSSARAGSGGKVFGLLGVAVSIGLLLGGCSSNTSSSSTSTSSPAAAAPTTVYVSVSVSAGMSGSSTPFSATVAGPVNLATHEAALTVNIPGTLAPLLSALPSSLTNTTKALASDNQLHIVLANNQMDIEVPGIQALLKGNEWVGIPVTPSEVTQTLSSAGSGLASLQGMESTLGATNTTSLGTQTIGGASATGHSATVSLSKILGLIPGLGNLISTQATTDLGTSLTVQIWTNAKGQVVQVNIADHSLPTKSSLTSLTATFSFTGFDSAVTITVPPTAGVTVLSTTALSSLTSPSTNSSSKSGTTATT